jgi:hypothetical protein
LVPLSGSAATGSVGTLTVAGNPDVTVSISGVSGTGARGSLNPSIALAVTGHAATGSLGLVAPSSVVVLTGQSATTALGTLEGGALAAVPDIFIVVPALPTSAVMPAFVSTVTIAAIDMAATEPEQVTIVVIPSLTTDVLP